MQCSWPGSLCSISLQNYVSSINRTDPLFPKMVCPEISCIIRGSPPQACLPACLPWGGPPVHRVGLPTEGSAPISSPPTPDPGPGTCGPSLFTSDASRVKRHDLGWDWVGSPLSTPNTYEQKLALRRYLTSREADSPRSVPQRALDSATVPGASCLRQFN